MLSVPGCVRAFVLFGVRVIVKQVLFCTAACDGATTARAGKGDCVVYQGETTKCHTDRTPWYLVQQNQQVSHVKCLQIPSTNIYTTAQSTS